MPCPFRPATSCSLWEKLKRLIFNPLNSTHRSSSTTINLTTILDTTIDSIIVADEYGIIQSCNLATETMFGYSKKELVGQNLTIIQPEPYCREHNSYIAAYLKTGKKHILGKRRELVGKKSNGLCFPIDLMVSEMFIEKKRLFLGIIRDITERAEALLVTQKNFLMELERENESNFLTTMSHELRTPLHSIMGFTECLLTEIDGPLNETQKTSLKQIDNSNKHLLSLVNGLLEVSKLQADQKNAPLESCNLAEILENAIQSISCLAEKKNLLIEKSIPPFKHLMAANKQQIQEIFLNLLDNAIKFTEHGKIKVSLTTNAKEVQITIQDTGIGIDNFSLPKIFIPFMKTPITQYSSKEHTGLGLSITKRLIELYQGRIEVFSTKGEGSTFIIYFPII